MDSLQPVDRFLLLASDRVGDVICYTLGIKMLRDFKPDATIDVLVFSNPAAEVLSNNSTIDAVYVPRSKREFRQLAQSYDAVICLRNSKDTQRCARWYKKTIMCPNPPNDIHLNMQAVVFLRNLLNMPEIPLSASYFLSPQPRDHQNVRMMLLERGASLADREILLGIHMGCRRVAKLSSTIRRHRIYGEKTKSWPFENFAHLIRTLTDKLPTAKFVLTGVTSESKLVRQYLCDIPNIIDLIGRTSVLEATALMDYLQVFVTGDTGPLHIAATTQVPIVALFSRTDPKIFGPYPARNDSIILYEPNMADITVARVEQAVMSAL